MSYNSCIKAGIHPGPKNVCFNFDVSAERRRLARNIAEATGITNKPILIYLHDNGRRPELSQKARDLITVHYSLKEIAIIGRMAWDVDWTELWKNNGDWPGSTFDQFLQLKTEPLSYEDLLTMRRLGVQRLPCFILLDADGTLLGFSEGQYLRGGTWMEQFLQTNIRN